MVPRKTHGRCWISLSSPWELAGDVARAHHFQASLPGLRPQQTGSHPLLLSKKRFSPKKCSFPSSVSLRSLTCWAWQRLSLLFTQTWEHWRALWGHGGSCGQVLLLCSWEVDEFWCAALKSPSSWWGYVTAPTQGRNKQENMTLPSPPLHRCPHRLLWRPTLLQKG